MTKDKQTQPGAPPGDETAGAIEGAWSDHPASSEVIELRPSAFSAKVKAHGRHPTHYGRMENPDAQAVKVGWCGEVMEMYLRLRGEQIVESSFWADGCLSTMACGDMLMTLVQDTSVDDALKIAPEALISALDGLPFSSHHCAELSVETFRAAVASRQEGSHT